MPCFLPQNLDIKTAFLYNNSVYLHICRHTGLCPPAYGTVKFQPEKRKDMATYNNLKPVEAPKFIEDFRQMLRTSAERFGDKALYNYKVNGELCSISYAEFYENVRAFSTALTLKGLAGKTIAVTGDTHPAWTAAFYSVMITGGIIVPLDHELDAVQMA